MKKMVIKIIAVIVLLFLSIVGIVVWKEKSKPKLPPITLQLDIEKVKSVRTNNTLLSPDFVVERNDPAEVMKWVQELNKLNFEHTKGVKAPKKDMTGGFEQNIYFCDEQGVRLKEIEWTNENLIRYYENGHTYECRLTEGTGAYCLISELMDEWRKK